jgi:hypothetical protein
MTKPQVVKQIRESAEESFLDAQFGQLDLSGFPTFAEPIKEESLEDEKFAPLASDRPMRLRNEINRFVNQNSNDPEIVGTLRAAGVEDQAAPHKFFLSTADEALVFLGKDNVWRVTVFFDGRQQTIKCASATSRDDAMAGANRWLNSKRGPQIRALSKDQELFIARLAGMGKREDAILNFLAYSVPDYEGTDISSDPKYTDVCNRCAWFVFIYSTPQYSDSEAAREFMTRYVGDRPVTVQLLQFAFNAYQEHEKKAERGLLLGQIEDRENQVESDGPTYEQLDDLDTETISKLREDTLRLRAKQVKVGILH